MAGNTSQIALKSSVRYHTLMEIRERKTIVALIYFALAALVSGGSLYGNCAPFGAAFVGASGAGLPGVCALLGAGLGYHAAFGFSESAEYIASCVMIYTVAFVCQYLPFFKKKFFMPGVVICVMGITMAFGSISTVREDTPYLARMVIEVWLSGCFTFLYGSFFSLELHRYGMISMRNRLLVAAVSATMLTPLSALTLGGCLSLGRSLMVAAVLLVSFCGDTSGGCSIAAIYGIVLDVSIGGIPMFSFGYPMCALICGVIGKRSKLLHCMVAFGCLTAFALTFGTMKEGTSILLESLAGCLLFALIPQKCLGAFRLQFRSNPTDDAEAYQDRLGDAEGLMEVFADVQTLLQGTMDSPGDADLMESFDRATEHICVRCGRQMHCWNNRYLNMVTVFKDLERQVKHRGRLVMEDLPVYFRENCEHPQELLGEINYQLRRNSEGRMVEQRIQEQRELLLSMLEDYSQVMLSVLRMAGGTTEESYSIRHRIEQYLNSIKCPCEVAVMQRGAHRLRIEISGKNLNRLLGHEQYLNDLSRLLNIRLRGLCDRKDPKSLLLLEAEPFSVSVGVASKRKQGEELCGDQCSYFKTEQGVLYVILSDGLGSGEHAKQQSSMVIGLLEKFLISGVPPQQSVRILNTIMTIRNEDHLHCATVDLLSVDLFSGKAVFYKYGAAPSYLMTGDTIIQISGKGVSVGLSDGGDRIPEMTEVILEPGNIAVMASDGVTLESREVLKQLIQADGRSMKRLAKSLLLREQTYGRGEDDMTVITIGLDIRQ